MAINTSTPTSDKEKILRRMLPVMVPLLIGVIFLIGTVVTFGSDLAFVIRAERVEGSYIGSVSHSGGTHGGTFLYPQFRFATKDGQAIIFTSKMGSTDQPYVDGQKVPILYDPAHPDDARMDSISLWSTPLFLAPFAILFTFIPVTILVVRRRRQESNRT